MVHQLWQADGGVFATPAAGGGEEMRGPHAALAARLAQRDAGRSFVLGALLLWLLVTWTLTGVYKR